MKSSKIEKLKAEGWTKMFLASETRLSEANDASI